jgi:hypothetical protein
MTEEFELPENTGNLFANKNKRQEYHPDYNGQIDIDGEVCKIKGYVRYTKAGDKYLYIVVENEREIMPHKKLF